VCTISGTSGYAVVCVQYLELQVTLSFLSRSNKLTKLMCGIQSGNRSDVNNKFCSLSRVSLVSGIEIINQLQDCTLQ
jgi:hypothetical protein